MPDFLEITATTTPQYYQLDETWQTWILTSYTTSTASSSTSLQNQWWGNHDFQLTGTSTTVMPEWVLLDHKHSLPKTRRKTPEEVRADERAQWFRNQRRIMNANRARAKELRRRIAERRAQELLLMFLDEEQRRQYVINKSFHVHTAAGIFLVTRGHAGNLFLLEGEEESRRVRRFCYHAYHPEGWIPDEDHMLAQKLMLESDVEAVLAEANVA